MNRLVKIWRSSKTKSVPFTFSPLLYMVSCFTSLASSFGQKTKVLGWPCQLTNSHKSNFLKTSLSESFWWERDLHTRVRCACQGCAQWWSVRGTCSPTKRTENKTKRNKKWNTWDRQYLNSVTKNSSLRSSLGQKMKVLGEPTELMNFHQSNFLKTSLNESFRRNSDFTHEAHKHSKTKNCEQKQEQKTMVPEDGNWFYKRKMRSAVEKTNWVSMTPFFWCPLPKTGFKSGFMMPWCPVCFYYRGSLAKILTKKGVT